MSLADVMVKSFHCRQYVTKYRERLTHDNVTHLVFSHTGLVSIYGLYLPFIIYKTIFNLATHHS